MPQHIDPFERGANEGRAIPDEALTAGVGTLRGSWESGRLSTDANALAAQEAGLRADGRNAEADTLRGQITAIQARQGALAPPVGRVEDIHGLGDAGSWALGQVGQGAASMADPLAAATAVGAAGRVAGLSKNPLAQGFSKAAPYLAPALAYGMNQRQLKGEFYNDAVQDPALMQRTSPQDLNRTAELYGAGASVLDTAMPGLVGKQLVGKGGLRVLEHMSPVKKLGLELLGEGGTEAAQEYGKQKVQGLLNPNRDTSGDASANLNSFAGGAVGAGPFAGAGIAAEHAHAGVGAAGHKLSEGTHDLLDSASAASDKVKGMFGKGAPIDLSGDADAAAKPPGFRMTTDELDTLHSVTPKDIDPQSPAYEEWYYKNQAERVQLAWSKLWELAGKEDPHAADLLTGLLEASNGDDPVAQDSAATAATKYLTDLHDESGVLGQAADNSRMAQAAGVIGNVAAKGAVAAGKGALRFGKALFGGAADALSKKNAQAAPEEEHKGELFGNYLAANSQASPLTRRSGGGLLAAHMREIGQQIADVGQAGKFDAPASALALNRIAHNLRVTFKGQAEAKISDMQAMADPAHAPLFDHLREAVTADKAPGAHQAREALRRSAAMSLVGMADPEVAGELAAHPTGATQLLGAVENVIAGRATPTMRRQLEKAVGGRDRFAKMLAFMNGDSEEEGGAEQSAVPEETSDRDKAAGEKNVAKGSGPKVYGFAKTPTPRSGGGKPFAATMKDGVAQRPQLFLDSDTVHANLGGGSAIENKLDSVKRHLKVDTTPARMADLLEQEGKPTRAESVRAAIEAAKTDPAVAAKLKDELESFFVNRAGEWNVQAKSALDVMHDHAMAPGEILAAYRDYLRQEARDEKRPEDERRALLTKARDAAHAVQDVGNGAEAAPLRKVNGPEFMTDEQHKGSGIQGAKQDDTKFRLGAGERKKVYEEAAAYFKERKVVVGEQLSDRDPSRITKPELTALTKNTAKTLDFARIAEKPNEVISEANILNFKDDGKDVGIRAGDLVAWVRKQQGLGEKSSASTDLTSKGKDQKYLDDLMEGVAIVMGSGHVDPVMPYKLNAQGKPESFAKGIPPSLRLATTTYAGHELRSKGKAKPEKAGPKLDYQEQVARDQARHEEHFVADPHEGESVEPTIAPEDYAALTPDERQQLNEMKTPAEQKAFVDDLSLRKSGEKFSDAPAAGSKTEAVNKTPLDHFPKQKDGAVPDDFADQRYQSGVEGFDATRAEGVGWETKLHAKRDAAKLGDNIVSQLKGDTQAGLDALATRLRTAERTHQADATGLTGGVQYVYPAAHALNADTIAKLDLAPAEAAQVVQLRAKTAKIILGSDLKPAEKVALAKMMAPDASADRITLGTFKSVLEKAAALSTDAAPEVAAKESPKSQAAPDGARKQNAQGTDPTMPASDAQVAEAKAYVSKVLGNQVKVQFEKLTGYSGEFIEHDNVIKISTQAAAGVLSTAYHEALHKFFSAFVKSDPKVLEAMRSLAENEGLLARVHALLKGFPAAQGQLKDGEERLAYIFQFMAAGKLDLPFSRATTIMQKLRKFFRRVTGMVSESERASDLLYAFHDGKMADPSAAGQVIADIKNQGTMAPAMMRKLSGITKRAAGAILPAETILAKSESATARGLAKMFFTNPGDEAAGSEQEGYLNARRTTASRNVNQFLRAVAGLSERDLRDVADHMQHEAELSDITYAPHREAVKAIRGQLQDFYKYMLDKGMDVKFAGDKYFPVSWSTRALVQDRQAFMDMLTTHYDRQLQEAVTASGGKITKEYAAARIHQALMDRGGTDGKVDVKRDDGVLAPFFANKENRELNWIAPEHRAPFLQKNLVGTMTGYFHQGVRAAEYTERFGAKGEHLANKLVQVRNELDDVSLRKLNKQEFDSEEQRKAWVDGEMKNIERSVGAMEGSLGKDITPNMRKFNSWMMVYQNLRLLPLSLFSSFVDPMGMVARGATMKEAYETFLRGMKEVFQNWGDQFRENPKERDADKWSLLAEHIGALDAKMLSHHVSEEYSSSYMSPGAKRINDALFRLNGMEAWNRGMRAGATRSAVKFIERHSALPDKTHSARWLKELGLTPADVTLDNEGELVTEPDRLMALKGITKAQAERETEKMYQALNRWVEGAILTPNAAQRPAWSSDPHYSMFFHLKQFSYSFQQTIMKRAVNEMNHGNLAPLGSFLWYIPTMIAADVTKGLIQGGGSLPSHMQGYNLGDWVKQGAERAGVLGIGGIGVDASHDLFSLAGPGVEQAVDALFDPIGKTTLNALPLHGLYAEMLR